MQINNRIKKLREQMEKYNIDVYIINTSDPHGSEYIPERYKSREWISGFTGSAGTAVITSNEALLWTDGRYFIQAEKETANNEFNLMTMGLSDSITYIDWIKENFKDNFSLGFDPETLMEREFQEIKNEFSDKAQFKTEVNLIDKIWTDRKTIPDSKLFILEEKYSGKSFEKKLSEVREYMKNNEIDYTVISSLDDIGWLFNLRARDVEYNPVFYSYSLITKDEVYLFVDTNKLSEEVIEYLRDNNIEQREYEDIYNHLQSLDSSYTCYLDLSKTNHKVYESINSQNMKFGINYTTILKAIKNSVELENQRKAYIRDGAALVKFFHWLENNVSSGKITELDASEKLLEFRSEDDLFIEPSFESISAYKENAAMMHYSPKEGENSLLKPEGLYLIDSGGQYYLGTTDITRTLALGKLTEEEIKDATLTFKSHLMLLNMNFLYGSKGHHLDNIARYHMWQNHLDYKSGTGHGIGYMLNVHEGPHRIAPLFNDVVFQEGMITSIEPGVYKSGKHGIRLENIVVAKEILENEFGKFMGFETLSFVPIDLDTIDVDMLDDIELKWLNQYHKDVYNKLSPYLNREEKEWLKINTRELRR